jgi:hypothetical protein
VFIFFSNIDMMMRLQPILFKGFSHRPRPSPEMAIHEMERNRGHLGIFADIRFVLCMSYFVFILRFCFSYLRFFFLSLSLLFSSPGSPLLLP